MPKEKARYLRNMKNGTVLGWNRILARNSDLQEISEEEAIRIDQGEKEEPTATAVVQPEVTEEPSEEEDTVVGNGIAVTDFDPAAEPPGEDDILAALTGDDG
jgi:hypothetical protein